MSAIAEDVLLLAYREDKGTPLISAGELDLALAGALLAELAIADRIAVQDKTLVVVNPAPVGDAELDAVLARIVTENQKKPRKPSWFVSKISSDKLRKRLLAGLAERGILSEQQRKLLGIFPTKRYPELDGSVERDLRQRVQSVLAGADPDERIGVLIALMHACRLARKAFPEADKERIKEISAGAWAGDAVRATIEAVNAAVMAAVIAAAVAGGAG
ncbi:GPP34 family phosphoprotein [Acrocarpospora sp. B8E8]|uniref:GOLPH3/VPS74 family protein n=1 Tax=Acrocarpospora sp. B8E8 TaxID=3153572 RepID=UPI00325D8E92